MDETKSEICSKTINAVEPDTGKAFGKVSVPGGGLSYCPCMVPRKDNVFKVVITEPIQAIYDLQQKYILPQF